jgi:hypothetical protein
MYLHDKFRERISTSYRQQGRKLPLQSDVEEYLGELLDIPEITDPWFYSSTFKILEPEIGGTFLPVYPKGDGPKDIKKERWGTSFPTACFTKHTPITSSELSLIEKISQRSSCPAWTDEVWDRFDKYPLVEIYERQCRHGRDLQGEQPARFFQRLGDHFWSSLERQITPHLRVVVRPEDLIGQIDSCLRIAPDARIYVIGTLQMLEWTIRVVPDQPLHLIAIYNDNKDDYAGLVISEAQVIMQSKVEAWGEVRRIPRQWSIRVIYGGCLEPIFVPMEVAKTKIRPPSRWDLED